MNKIEQGNNDDMPEDGTDGVNIDEPARKQSNDDSHHRTRRYLSSLANEWHSLLFDRILFPDRKSQLVRDKNSNSTTSVGVDAVSVSKKQQQQNHQLPVLPHTTLVEILAFCDARTLLAFRGACGVFRDLEIPREFHQRAMTKLKPKSRSDKDKDKNHHQSQKRRRRRSPTTTQAVRYSYKEKVIDKEHRKVWIYLRDIGDDDGEGNDNSKDDDDDDDSKVPRINPTTTASHNKSINDNSDPHPHHWTLQIITAKVLKLIRDIEFYNGVVFGYDEAKAKALLLQKGSIDDEDFPGPMAAKQDFPRNGIFCKHKHHRNSSNSKRNNLFPMYGSWRAEASVRPLSLKEALEILSDKGSIKTKKSCQPQPRWRRRFINQKLNQLRKSKSSANVMTRSGSTDDEIDTSNAISLLLAASGLSLPLEEANASKSFPNDFGIRLAEYSTVFDGTRMTCSVLLVRTLGGAVAEVRVVSGMIEPPKSALASSRFSWRGHPRRSKKRRRARSMHIRY